MKLQTASETVGCINSVEPTTVSPQVPRTNVKEQLDKLAKRRVKMITHLNMKVEEEDWYGVADVAMDLREIDAVLGVWKDLE